MASVEAVRYKNRVAKALHSLQQFGLTEPDVLPTLRRLLKMFDNEWEFIEAENYRTLIDSIFEAQDAKNTSRGGGGGPAARARRADSGSDEADHSDYSPSPPRGSSPPPANANPATSRRSNGRSAALVPVKKSNSPVSGRGGNALPENVARAVDYHSGASVRTRAATLSLQGGGSPGTRGRAALGSASADAAAAAAHEREKGKSPLVPESRRQLPSQSREVKGPPNLVTVKLEVSNSSPIPLGFEKVSFEKVDGVIKVMTPNRAGPSPRPAHQLAPPLTNRVIVADEPPIHQTDPGNQVFSPAPLLAKDPISNVTVVYVKNEPVEAPPDHEDASWDQSVQRELSLDVAAQPSPSRLQIVLHGTVFAEDPPPAEKASNVTGGPSIDQAPRVELEEQDGTVLPADNIEDRDGNVLSLVDYEDDPDPPEQETGGDVGRIPDEQVVEPPELHGANIRPNFIISGSKRDIMGAQIAFEPKRQKCEAITLLESDSDINKSAPLTAPLRRRLILAQSPSPDRRLNSGSECTPLEGPTSSAGVKRKLMIPILEGNSSASKEMGTSNGDDNTVRNVDMTKAVADRCEERGKGTLEARGQGNRNSALKRVRLEPRVEDQNAQKLKHDPADISRGTESMPIPFVNEFTSETIDHRFNYVPRNVVYQNAYFNISLARIGDEDCCVDCVGDCLNAPHSCPCTRETGGVFAYTQDGFLKEQFIDYELGHNEKVYCASGWACPIERAKADFEPDKCKGHLVRKFVKECWHKCGCSMQCGNRVVQRGITRQLQVFFTNDGKGWGLRTVEDLPAGSFVCEYVGEIMTNNELDQRNQEVKTVDACLQAGTHKDTYPLLLDADWCSESGLKDEEALCLDATRYGNVARFINHRCSDANLVDVPVSIEGMDRHYYHVAFFTNRAVKAGEELTWVHVSFHHLNVSSGLTSGVVRCHLGCFLRDSLRLFSVNAFTTKLVWPIQDYKIDFDDEEHPIEAFHCLCKSGDCRGLRANGTKKHKK